MDCSANPVVQLQDIPSNSQADTIPNEGGSVMDRMMSRQSKKSETTRSVKELPQPPKLSSRERSRSRPDEEHALEVDPEDDFPEGGLKAWLVVAGAFLTLLPTFGFTVAIGTLQDYWAQHQLSNYTASAIGWIPSVFVYISLALGIWVGPLFDRYGPRWIALTGSSGYVMMIFLLAECKAYWQMILCVGILGGATCAMLTTISLAAVAHWFKAQRGLAQGIAMVGSSFGGLSIPLILRSTLPEYGYAWSLRILGFEFLACFVVGNLLLKARIPPTAAAKKKAIISLSIFKDFRFSLLTISVFGFEVVLFGALGVLPTYVTLSTKFTAATGFYLISVLNGVSCLGRILAGYLADRIGRFNSLLIMLIFTLIWMLAIWLPLGTQSLAALYCFSALFGFGTGSWMALTPACIGQLCRAEEFGRYYGSMYFIASLATLVCIPISAELVQTVGAKAMVGFFCIMLALSTVSFVFSRWACLGKRWVVREWV